MEISENFSHCYVIKMMHNSIIQNAFNFKVSAFTYEISSPKDIFQLLTTPQPVIIYLRLSLFKLSFILKLQYGNFFQEQRQ